MKKLRVSLSIALIGLVACMFTVNAQTYHEDIRSDFYAPVMCLEKVLKGYWIYSISYHVDKKTGEITQVHWQVKKAYLEDEDGNTYKLIDTGTDNYGGPLESLGGGSFYYMWNNIAGLNAAAIEYFKELLGDHIFLDMTDSNGDPLEDGWMNGDSMAEPYEGIMTNTFKFIGKHGEKVSLKEMVKYHVDEEGNLVEDFRRVQDKCNW